MGKFVIKEVATGYKFNLLAGNGQIVATSEVYESMAACRKGIDSVVNNAPAANLADLTVKGKQPVNPKFELYQDKAGEYRFRLKARNGHVIAVSEGYTVKISCENGIESVRKNAVDAEVVEV